MFIRSRTFHVSISIQPKYVQSNLLSSIHLIHHKRIGIQTASCIHSTASSPNHNNNNQNDQPSLEPETVYHYWNKVHKPISATGFIISFFSLSLSPLILHVLGFTAFSTAISLIIALFLHSFALLSLFV